MKKTRDTCPNCGTELARNAKACPECGSDEETGWSEDLVSGLDLPDEEFNYDEFVKEEFGEGKQVKPRGLRWFWWTVGVILLLALIGGMLARL